MWFFYLDESGELGFDFSAKHPSRVFTVCILVVPGVENNRRILSAVRKTLRRKHGRTVRLELKGSHASLAVKKYFYSLVADVPFDLYAMTLDKQRVYEELAQRKDRVYNFIARQVLDRVPFEDATTRVDLIIDRSKNSGDIGDFNGFISRQLQGRLDPRVPLDIYHHRSTENLGLQAVDLFSWGIFRKHERNDVVWCNVFRDKVRRDDRYL